MKRKKISTKVKAVFAENISHILSGKKYIVFAYIFGSFASERSFHDIDVGLFVSDTEGAPPLELELRLEAELEDSVGLPVDVRVINNAPLTFVYNVLKGGVVVLDRDASLRADYEGLIYKKYFDFRHLSKEYLREIAHAPV